MKPALVPLLAAAGLAGVFLMRGTPQNPAPPASQVTLLLTLGHKASALEKWDGTAKVSGARIAATEGRHFSAGDRIDGPGAWRCTTRRDEIAPYADIHYTEMRPGSVPPVLFHAVGVYLTLEPAGDARVAVETGQGNFDLAVSALGERPAEFLNGRVTVARVPSVEKLSTPQYEDDEPSIAAAPNGALAAAWVAYRSRADRVLVRTQERGVWSAPEEVTAKPADIFRCSLAYDEAGNLWTFWSERDQAAWHIWARQKKAGVWQTPVKLSAGGSNTFHRASAGAGKIFVAWQSFRQGQSDIYLNTYKGAWSGEVRISESMANDWEPAVAAGADGSAHIAWDTYDRANYDIHYRAIANDGRPSPVRAVTSSPKFEAHAAVAVDARNRPWVAWNESGVNWGKDQGFLIPVPLSVPLHQQRAIRVAMWNGASWMETREKPAASFAPDMRQNAEHPQIAFDGKGALTMVFRHWTRRNKRSIGSPMVWENYAARLDASGWSEPQALAHSGSWVEKHASLARDSQGEIWAAWMTDNRPFSTQIPANADVFCARLGAPRSSGEPALEPLAEPPLEAIPVHSTEAADVKAIRSYTIAAGQKRYKIYRGDMHRHTDFSQDFKYDGSLLEVYRYALDAAGFDYIAPTDHQTGFDQEYSWWQNEKLVDLFHVPGAFTPMFAFERSLPYPNGHRNVVFSKRGNRTLPIPPEERDGKTGAAQLYAYLRQTGGISMPHSSATAQGTDWRDNDPQVEPLMEIFQGYRNSYEYEGAPRSATELNPHAQKSGWQPLGFWWNALAKGYKIGVQASSDHWSTHISYACLLAENPTREGLLDAIRKRHAYAATDNIIVDFRARAGGVLYVMGDSFAAQSAPQLLVNVAGTGVIKQIDIVRNQKFAYTVRPGAKQARFEFTDQEFNAQPSYYYLRVLQEDGQLAWSSPVWVNAN